VIVNANSGRLLDTTLEHLARQTTPPTRTVVVDNASTDGSAERVERLFPDIELIRMERNIGFAAANNVAARVVADCELIALLNPDAFAEPSWLEALLAAAAEAPAHSSFASRLMVASSDGVLDGTGDVYHVSGLAWRRDHGRPLADAGQAPAGEIFSPCAAAALYRRDAFLAAGGFDESYFCYLEDVDLGFRMRLKGELSLYVPTSVVHHVGSSTAGRESDFQIYHSQRNMVWTFVKNMPGSLLWRHLAQHVVVNVLTVVWYSLRGQAKTVARAKRDALKGLPRVIRARREVQASRAVSPREARAWLDGGLRMYTGILRRALRR
jgi:GT2 family glycosyltransferase